MVDVGIVEGIIVIIIIVVVGRRDDIRNRDINTGSRTRIAINLLAGTAMERTIGVGEFFHVHWHALNPVDTTSVATNGMRRESGCSGQRMPFEIFPAAAATYCRWR